ncbi:MAG: carcinine hydrolase/isopenicillin-N N-acyltransferase family protein [Sphaerochaetaceae bacterium]|jgi:hypothetical protein|nr:carcinine hydrolase/isopenicillin-N N-acyltransferase family protein [Sphaerochaetaceae bacterium]MDD2405770.1 carcinine hydrolase/isopenicillin-N N-acyltransferase family protein [Sphaerochaetaceae bacterium]MDD3671562.1 carcinine hydrolase/isopenicillin-N N-acyltransferase family protein [Sphaerochaetaceae bacterium]MDD4259231.1 carcinine hydrolase/isopenicillin-N N-acyltransferase family protein [Sphaerochaetaceae bacterium]
MCDTIAFKQPGGQMFFGKNSDRHPSELQMVSISSGYQDRDRTMWPDNSNKYDTQFNTLMQIIDSFTHPYMALISRPIWIWGAEMGINELGVAIGNEAVFSKGKKESTGLLGMDILRLALHNSKTAYDAALFIVRLIETYGQGGDGSYKGHLYYDNSFLITDRDDIIVLETAGRRWVMKKMKGHASISNSYSIGTDYDSADTFTSEAKSNFKKMHASALHAWFSKGYKRQRTTETLLAKGCVSYKDIRDILLFNRGTSARLDRSMQSICLDAGFPLPSRTTASMIVEYGPKAILAWCNPAPLPCYHPYIPQHIGKQSFKIHNEPNTDRSYLTAIANHKLTTSILTLSSEQKAKIAVEARALEHSFDQIVRQSFVKGDLISLEEDCNTCWAMSSSFRQQFATKYGSR